MRDQTLHENKNKCSDNVQKKFEHDLQSNSENVLNNLKVPPSECYYNTIICRISKTILMRNKI